MSKVKVKLLAGCIIEGKPAKAGSTVSLPKSDAAQLVAQGTAEVEDAKKEAKK